MSQKNTRVVVAADVSGLHRFDSNRAVWRTKDRQTDRQTDGHL